jgi:hypothetical protein
MLIYEIIPILPPFRALGATFAVALWIFTGLRQSASSPYPTGLVLKQFRFQTANAQSLENSILKKILCTNISNKSNTVGCKKLRNYSTNWHNHRVVRRKD